MINDQAFTRQPPPGLSFRLASQNTSLAFQNTGMGTDRTLMAVIGTSLSLISCGFTTFKVAQNLGADNILKISVNLVPHFGIGLVLLGIMVLRVGIIYHVQFMRVLRSDRKRVVEDGLIRGESPFSALVYTLNRVYPFCFWARRDHEHALSRRPVRMRRAPGRHG